MTPEEFEEARRLLEFTSEEDAESMRYLKLALDHIKELDAAVSGPLENITKMFETVNADTIFSGIIQTWKTENDTLKTRITELEAQVAALQEIAIGEGAYILSVNVIESTGVDEFHRKTAKDLLSEEHPEAFR